MTAYGGVDADQGDHGDGAAAGWRVNHKRVYRLYGEEGLSVRSRRRRRRTAQLRIVAPAPTGTDQRWAIDFVSDATADGRRLRVLAALDVFSRECLALHVAPGIRSADVTCVLDRAIARRRAPLTIQCDNGSEFSCNHFDRWAHERGIRIDFIRPGRPVENAHIESFNGRLRDECLNGHWFTGLDDARRTIEDWRKDYNERRPHSSLGDRAPATFVAELLGSSPAAPRKT